MIYKQNELIKYSRPHIKEPEIVRFFPLTKHLGIDVCFHWTLAAGKVHNFPDYRRILEGSCIILELELIKFALNISF